MTLISSKAEKIADDVLSSNEEILSVSVIDWTGNILAVKSRESFRKRFRVSSLEGSRYSGTLAIATPSLVNEVKDVFGEPQAIITLYKISAIIAAAVIGAIVAYLLLTGHSIPAHSL